MPFDNPKVKLETTNKQIFVTWQKEGIHQYPGAPEGVEFLQYPHRPVSYTHLTLPTSDLV